MDEAQDRVRLVYETILLEEIYQSQIFSVFILFYFLCYNFVNFYRKYSQTNDLKKLEKSKKLTWSEILERDREMFESGDKECCICLIDFQLSS